MCIYIDVYTCHRCVIDVEIRKEHQIHWSYSNCGHGFWEAILGLMAEVYAFITVEPSLQTYL